jgi:hypothetical protein
MSLVETAELRKQLARQSLEKKWAIPQKTNDHNIFEGCPFCDDKDSNEKVECLCPPKLCCCCFGSKSDEEASLIGQFSKKYATKRYDYKQERINQIDTKDFRAVRRILLKTLRE